MKQEGFTRKESFAHERAVSCCFFVYLCTRCRLLDEISTSLALLEDSLSDRA